MSWAWWDWPLTWLTNHRPSVLWRCWLGHVTRKIVSKMTYNVSSGTLNSAIPYHTLCDTTWRTSPMSVVLQIYLVSGWGLQKTEITTALWASARGGTFTNYMCVCLSVRVCLFICKITRKCINGCWPRLVGVCMGDPPEVIKFWCSSISGCRSSITSPNCLVPQDGAFYDNLKHFSMVTAW